MTKPDVAQGVVKDCQQAGIKRVWLYRVSGTGAVSPAAVEFCEKNGITVIPGFCPYMFLAGTQWFHRLHGAVLKLVGKYPK
jgi:predicted CoA-binding protein